MRVPLDHRGVRPAHDVHHRPLGDAQEQQGCGGCVTRIVQACVADSGFLQQGLPLVLVAAGIDGLAGRLGEDPAAFMPFGPSVLPFLILALAVLDDQVEQLVGQGDATTTGRGLHFHLDQAATMALRTPAGMAGAVGRTGRWACALVSLAVLRALPGLVIASAAGMRIGATVLPGLPLQAFHDLQCFAWLVQPRPFQPECLSLTQPKRQGDDEPHSVALAERQCQDALDLLGLEGINLCVFDPQGLGEGDGIPGNVAAFERLSEGGPGRAVYLVRSGGPEPVRQHPCVQLLEVLGLDAVDPVCAEPGRPAPPGTLQRTDRQGR